MNPAIDPVQFGRDLSADGVIAWSEKLGGWAVTGYDLAKAVLLDKRFSAVRLDRLFPGNSDFKEITSKSLFFRDLPKNDSSRTMLGEYLRYKNINELCVNISDSTIAGLRDRPSWDLVTDYSECVTLRVLSEILNIEYEYLEHARKLAEIQVRCYEGVTSGPFDHQLALDSANEIRQLLNRIMSRSGLGGLVANKVEQGLIGENEGFGLLLDAMLAGQIPLSNLIVNGFRVIDERPHVKSSLDTGKDSWAQVIDEVLRLESPNQLTSRVATEAIKLADIQIESNELVFIMLGAANRDATVFEAPDEFRTGRKPQHLAFGAGSHHCLGAALAHTVGQRALERLFGVHDRLQRVPDGEMWGRQSLRAYGPTRLLLAWL